MDVNVVTINRIRKRSKQF